MPAPTGARTFVAGARANAYDGAPHMQARTEPPPALTRNALIPASIATCFVLVYAVEVRPFWVFPIGIAVMALYLAAPWIGKRSLARFDRDAVQLLARGRRADLEPRYRRALGMRLFAPPALVAERRGFVAAETGAPARAREAYLAALEGYGPGEAPLAVRLGLAHACYALGDDDEAIRAYRSVMNDAGGLPRVAQSLAHALARRGDDLNEAERLADELLRDAGERASAEVRLLRALVHAKRGQKAPARKLLTACRDADGELAKRLRAEVEQALEG